ncbi:MAG: IclR family transcriptional regulator [Pseudomonadota bacterium]
MGTVHKALSLLDFFSEKRTEIGLSELARLSAFDKATVLRLMTSLADRGFVEQHAQSGKYRLGPALVRLANIREASFPQKSAARPILQRLSEASGETAHLVLLVRNSLETIDFIESRDHAIRVRMDAGERIPLHASASGIACLAFMPNEDAEAVLSSTLERFTRHTVNDKNALSRLLDTTRRSGVAEVDQGFEEGVYGMAAPLFAADGSVTGSVGIATPITRINAGFRKQARLLIQQSASEITEAWGGSERKHRIRGAAA